MARAVIVFHSFYGCDTGCCGHRVGIIDPLPDNWAEIVPEKVPNLVDWKHEYGFEFIHPKGVDDIEWAKKVVAEELGAEHVADLDWEHSWLVDD